jgi:hypothetical protein
MKAPKAICAAIVLALTLSIPTYAGDVLIPGYTAPPPPPPPVSTTDETSSSPDSIFSTQSSTTLGELTPGFDGILWVIASIF